MINTGTMSYTINLDENGNEVFPCRCGATHKGNYAAYDYGHHDCLHETDLVEIDKGYLLCPDCGKTWHVESL